MDARIPPRGVTGIHSSAAINQVRTQRHSSPCETDNWFDIQIEGNSNSTAKFSLKGIVRSGRHFGAEKFPTVIFINSL